MNKELQELFSIAGSMISQLGRYNGNNNEAQARKALRDIKEYLDEFFSQNVVIPIGETITIQKKVDVDEWVDAGTFLKDHEYRIKPSEPVYEYLWNINIRGVLFRTEDFLTKKEANEATHYVVKHIEETKRVRQ